MSIQIEDSIKKSLGFSLFPYQKYVTNEIIEAIEKKGKKFIVVSMPTGSGKTIIELLMAKYLLDNKKIKNVLVLEPTRLLCDQMYYKFWKKVFDDVGMEYEGDCTAFEQGKKIIVSTPFTASKCAPEFDAIIVDEVHHAFGDMRYEETIVGLEPKILLGFTALLPSYKKYMIDPRIVQEVGNPLFLNYDFKALSKIDPTFNPPKAIADVFDAEMNKEEDSVYEAFFRGQIKGNKDTLKFLEGTFYSYGKEAFCESFNRLSAKVEENPYVDFICQSKELSHKARALRQILSIYKIEDFKPVLIFTSRRATAYEFEKAISDLDPKRIKVLTGDSSRFERQKIVQSAKRGEIDVIISTLVGEEGIDIPEAKLLIMTDVPQSALRFYQRLGRLIRSTSDNEKNSNNKASDNNKEEENQIKYLVVALTPKTPEYDNLDDALRNLYIEGVDVSYIVEKKEGKGPIAKVIDIVNKSGNIVSYEKLTGNKALDVLEALLSPKEISDHQMSSYIDRAIKENKLYYYYDIDSMSNFVSKVLLASYCNLCYGEQCNNVCTDDIRQISKIILEKKNRIRIEKKAILRMYMTLMSPEKIEEEKKKFETIKSDLLEKLKGKEYSISISSSSKGSTYSIQLTVTASINGITIYPKIQIDYYDANSEEKEIAKLNSELIAYKGIHVFYSNFTK
ncbi:DEAD/DEAH box helicase [Acidianus sulfidivorans JP7]|uniref:RNA helicase n=1 Tax=Acidianus sulfidivorans JP7 TaxID=619593 RepID=A0A2U9ILT9_9CREN|nr:DEAD/DEAH box helicase [Acidianus sulfidivorans]AWR96965.1 DEAD/DEAH box helicase [Acidianus sulfidivorans JP7]